MAIDRQAANINWYVKDDHGNWIKGDFGGAQLAVLMDIRRELQTLNSVFRCPNFLHLPHDIRTIRRNTTKRKRRKVSR